MNYLTKIHKTTSENAKQGSSLMVVLIIMGIVSALSASLLRLGTQETDFNGRRAADIQGKHVAESAIEMAMAKLENNFRETQSITASIPTIALTGVERSLLLANSQFVTEVRITSVTNRLLGQRVFIDSEDPDTLLDPHRGAFLSVSEWEVQVEVDLDYRSQTRSIQASQRFQVRESPFFTHAIFYNMDLEFHPGPEMTVMGPVHSNGDIWLSAVSNLYFQDRVSATKNIRVGMMKDSFGSWHGGQSPKGVWFNTNGVAPPAGFDTTTRHGITYANLHDGGASYSNENDYFHSLNDTSDLENVGFDSLNLYFLNRFDGNLWSGSENAPKILPPSMPDYVADDGTGNGMNSGYSLIEPLMPGASSGGGINSAHKGEAEKEKFAYKAGLTLEVVYSPGGAPANLNAVRLLTRKEDSDGNQIQVRSNAADLSDYYLIPRKARRSNAFDMDTTDTTGSPVFPVLDGDGNAVTDDDGNPVTQTVSQVNKDDVFISPAIVDKMLTMRIYNEHGNKPTSYSGIYDMRRNKALDLVELDMGGFRTEFVEAPFDDRFHHAGSASFNPSTHYNGVVYVQFPTTSSYTSRNDKIVVANDDIRNVSVGSGTRTAGLGLLVSNAAQLPNPTYNALKAPGFTLATNGTTYIQGHFNADGNMGTGSPVHADGESAEYNALASIAADSITFLSNRFDFTKAKGNQNDRDAENTEVNAALLSGITPTNKPNVDYDGDGTADQISSGGSHNFTRFLEDWGGKTFRYRGSIVAFFESEIGIEPQEQNGNSYYSPPNRAYGFYDVFGTGSQPPGTPMGRTFFKLDFRFL